MREKTSLYRVGIWTGQEIKILGVAERGSGTRRIKTEEERRQALLVALPSPPINNHHPCDRPQTYKPSMMAYKAMLILIRKI